MVLVAPDHIYKRLLGCVDHRPGVVRRWAPPILAPPVKRHLFHQEQADFIHQPQYACVIWVVRADQIDSGLLDARQFHTQFIFRHSGAEIGEFVVTADAPDADRPAIQEYLPAVHFDSAHAEAVFLQIKHPPIASECRGGGVERGRTK